MMHLHGLKDGDHDTRGKDAAGTPATFRSCFG
jgi:hypothetical protein